MARRPRLREASGLLARRLATRLLDRVARTAASLVAQLDPPAPRCLASSPAPTVTPRASVRASEAGAHASAVEVPPRPTPPPAATPAPAPPSAAPRDSAAPAAPPRRDPATAPTPEPETTPASEPAPATSPAPAASDPTDTAARIASAPTVGWALVDILGRRLQPALAALAVEDDDPTDSVDTLKELRVATRRLRALCRVYAPILGDKTARRLNRRLRKITRAAGEVRQWDAHRELLAPLLRRAEQPLTRAALEHVAAWVHDQRNAAAEAHRDRLRARDRRRLAEDLSVALDQVCGHLLRLGDEAEPRVRPWLATALRPLATRAGPAVHTEDLERLHAIRIAAKRARYLFELTRPAIAEAYRGIRRPAKRVQRTIGRYHDTALTEALLVTRRDELRADGHETLAGALDELVTRLGHERVAGYTAARPWTEVFNGEVLATFADALLPEADAPDAPQVAGTERREGDDASEADDGDDQSDDGLT